MRGSRVEDGKSGAVIQEGVPACEHDDVELAPFDEIDETSGRVRANADRGHLPGRTKGDERAEPLSGSTAPRLIRIMSKQHVDPFETKPFAALSKAPSDA